MLISTKHRTDKPEIMDDFTVKGGVIEDALDKISKINQFLGGNKLTLQGVNDLISKIDESVEITIVDLGCGNGDMLRMLADYAEHNNLKFNLIGIDANNFTISYAKELSLHYPNIQFRCEDIFGNKITELDFDIVLLTLTLHHFKNEEIDTLLASCHKKATLGIVINDLHRSSIAYRLFQGLCFVLRLNPISREDGLTSILRGFKKAELIPFSEKLNCKNYTIQWKWAFRYQWIISKI